MFQNKKLKRNATYAIAEVAEVALCASDCALPTSGYRLFDYYQSVYGFRCLSTASNQRAGEQNSV